MSDPSITILGSSHPWGCAIPLQLLCCSRPRWQRRQVSRAARLLWRIDSGGARQYTEPWLAALSIAALRAAGCRGTRERRAGLWTLCRREWGAGCRATRERRAGQGGLCCREWGAGCRGHTQVIHDEAAAARRSDLRGVLLRGCRPGSSSVGFILLRSFPLRGLGRCVEERCIRLQAGLAPIELLLLLLLLQLLHMCLPAGGGPLSQEAQGLKQYYLHVVTT